MYFQEKNTLKNNNYHNTKRALYCLCKHKYYLLYSIFLIYVIFMVLKDKRVSKSLPLISEIDWCSYIYIYIYIYI